MKIEHKNTLEIANFWEGAIPSSRWVSGSGNYVRKRAIPPCCEEIAVDKINELKGRSKIAALRLQKRLPKVRKIIVVWDWKTVNALKSQAEKELAAK